MGEGMVGHDFLPLGGGSGRRGRAGNAYVPRQMEKQQCIIVLYGRVPVNICVCRECVNEKG